ncbi:phosphotransferase [Desulfobacterales bacterium HSG17]|nr:phosphotransferase [Desulfobacterales bacterium HSG17]
MTKKTIKEQIIFNFLSCIPTENIQITPLQGGRNNRVFKVLSDSGVYFLKQYFTSKKDLRDRLETEFSFSVFAWKKGIRNIAKPLKIDRENKLALFEWIEGQKPKFWEIPEKYSVKALDFIKLLNQACADKSVSILGDASDACFSLNDHVSGVEKRLTRLQGIQVLDTIDKQALSLIVQKLVPGFVNQKQKIIQNAKKRGYTLNQPIENHEKIISPSDFGFHNAMIKKGQVCFFDFEYAGWDDPVKLICDFFSQPDYYMPDTRLEQFIMGLRQVFSKNIIQTMLWKTRMLMKIYQIKWCCIILNDFLKDAGERRKFASFNRDFRKVQLEKALKYSDRNKFLE